MTLAALLKQQARALRARNAAAIRVHVDYIAMGEFLATDLDGDMGSPFGMGRSRAAAIEELETKHQERAA